QAPLVTIATKQPPDVHQITRDFYGGDYKALRHLKGIQNGRCVWSVREIPMINPFHFLLGNRPCLRAAIRTSILIVGSLSCFAASAQTYPISGVWVAMEQRFLVSKTGACLTLKILGADALFDGPFPTVVICSVSDRVVVL